MTQPAQHRLLPLVLLPFLLATCALPEPIRPPLRAYTQDRRVATLQIQTRDGRDTILEGIELYNPTGSIQVRNAEVPELETRLRVSAENEETAMGIAMACRVKQHMVEGWLRLELWPPDGTPIERIGIHFTLKVPVGSKLRLRSRQGLIDTTAAKLDALELQTQGGTLRAGEIKGQLDFSNRSGKTVILGNYANINGWSDSGELLVRKFPRQGNLVFIADSGRATLFIKKDEPVFIEYMTKTGKLTSDLSFSRESGVTAQMKRETLKLGGGKDCCRVFLTLPSGSLQMWAN